MILFSDRGTTDGYHRMHGYSGHTFKFVNEEGKFHYVQIHFKARSGFKSLDQTAATKIAAEDPDYGIRSLHDDIVTGNFPTWDVYVVCPLAFGPSLECKILIIFFSKQ
jgi:catalase